MKRINSIIAILMAAALILSLTSAAAFADSESDLEYIMNKGTLVVGFDDAFPPFSYQADDGSYDGFDLACAKDLAERFSYYFLLRFGVAACRALHLVYDEDHLACLVLIDRKAPEVFSHV